MGIKQHVIFVLLAIVSTLGGCATPKGFVAKEWSDMLREMQITAVYPPRVDIQPGDVYTDPYPTKSQEDEAFKEKGFLVIPSRLATINLTTKIERYYQQERFEFPVTPGGADGKKEYEASANAGTSVFAGRINGRLPLVAFPEFSYVDVTTGNLSALVPINALPARLGIAGGDYSNVSLKLRGAESYGLARAEVFAAFSELLQDQKFAANLFAVWPVGATARLVTEVFLVREIEITAQRKESLGASAGAGSIPQTEGPDLSSGKGAEERIQSLQSTNTQLKALADPGGFFQVMSASDRGITLKRILTRPVAVGIKFIRVKRTDVKTVVALNDDLGVGEPGGSSRALIAELPGDTAASSVAELPGDIAPSSPAATSVFRGGNRAPAQIQ